MFTDKFWIAVAFVVFIALMWRPLAKFIATALDKRAAAIEAELNEAVRLREEAQTLLAEFQRKQRDAVLEAENIVNRAKNEAELMLRDAERELEEQLNKRIEMAMQKIRQAETQMVLDIKAQAVEAAIASAESLLRGQGSADKQALMQQSMKLLQKKLH